MTSKTIPTEERVSDERFETALNAALLAPLPFIAPISRASFVSMIKELLSLRSQPTRESVIEEAAMVADLGAEAADELMSKTIECEEHDRHLIRRDTCKKVAEQIRTLKSPSAKE